MLSFKRYLLESTSAQNIIFQSLNNLGNLELLGICGDYCEDKGLDHVKQLIHLYLNIFKQKDFCKYVRETIGTYNTNDQYKSIEKEVISYCKNNNFRVRVDGSGGGFHRDSESLVVFHPSYGLHADKEEFEYSIVGRITGRFGDPSITSHCFTFAHENEFYKNQKRTGGIYSSTVAAKEQEIPEVLAVASMGIAIAKILSEYTLHCANN